MCVLYTVSLLVALLSVSSAAPAQDDCSHLVKRLAPEDRHKIFGKWILIEGFVDHELFGFILRKTNSSWMEILPTLHTETVLLNQGNLIDGKCLSSSINMTYNNMTFQITQENATSTGHAHICPDCLIMHFNSTISSISGVSIRSLYIFGKNRTLPESELELFWKQAECLHYPQSSHYSYDGVTEFCGEKKETPHTA